MPDRLHYTDSDEANALIATDPMALLIGFALDQQVPVQKAFSGPLVLKERLGALDAETIAAADLEPVFRDRPAIHRFPGAMASASTTSPSTFATATTATPPASGPRQPTATPCARTSRGCPASAR